jgi:hypothetical protein
MFRRSLKDEDEQHEEDDDLYLVDFSKQLGVRDPMPYTDLPFLGGPTTFKPKISLVNWWN